MLLDLAHPGRAIWVGCDAYQCPTCGPRKWRAFSRAVAWQADQHEHSRFVTVTQVPEGWQETREAMKQLVRKVRLAGYRCEWAWTLETGKETGMRHAHCVQWGDYVPQDVLQDLWGHRVDIRAIKGGAEGVAAYVAKGAGAVTRYLAKGAREDYEQALALNGGRPVHTTRGFFEGRGVRGALDEVKAAHPQAQEGTWTLCPPDLAKHLHALASRGDEAGEQFGPDLVRTWFSLPPEGGRRSEDSGDVRGDDLDVHLIDPAAVVAAPPEGTVREPDEPVDGRNLLW